MSSGFCIGSNSLLARCTANLPTDWTIGLSQRCCVEMAERSLATQSVSEEPVIKAGIDYVPPPYIEDRYSAALPERVTPEMLVSMVAGERAGDGDYQRWAESDRNVEVAGLLRLSGAEETKHAERLAAALGLE